MGDAGFSGPCDGVECARDDLASTAHGVSGRGDTGSTDRVTYAADGGFSRARRGHRLRIRPVGRPRFSCKHRLRGAATTTQALCETVQCPAVVGVALEIGAVDRFGFRHLSRVEEQRAQGMTDGLHPARRFCIGQRVLDLHPRTGSSRPHAG